jgi:hypothetical protein
VLLDNTLLTAMTLWVIGIADQLPLPQRMALLGLLRPILTDRLLGIGGRELAVNQHPTAWARGQVPLKRRIRQQRTPQIDPACARENPMEGSNNSWL